MKPQLLGNQIEPVDAPPIDCRSFEITLFTVPKPFEKPFGDGNNATDMIQRNAIESWRQLSPVLNVLVLGDEPGIKETAAAIGVRHVSGLERNEHGTPMLSSAFQLAHQHSPSPLLMYCNCDVILEPKFLDAIEYIDQSPLRDSFVAFGRRLDVPIDWELRLDQPHDRDRFRNAVESLGKSAPVVCKEYFVFPRALYSSIPDFAVGRGNWDNWMIWHARDQGIPAVDLSDQVQVVHQNHDYRHQKNSRGISYVSGAEAKENERLAGGRHVISGSSGTWRLTQRGLRKTAWPNLNWNFWRDLPRFARLLAELVLKR